MSLSFSFKLTLVVVPNKSAIACTPSPKTPNSLPTNLLLFAFFTSFFLFLRSSVPLWKSMFIGPKQLLFYMLRVRVWICPTGVALPLSMNCKTIIGNFNEPSPSSAVRKSKLVMKKRIGKAIESTLDLCLVHTVLYTR